MCGIAGMHSATDHPDDVRRVVGEMVASLHHRGPDDRGFFHSGPFAMGMTRLSIVDVAGGHQPISSEDGMVTVICNGEIYNHVELRRDLEAAHRFSTKSDAEVIVHLYEELGTQCVQRLRGMFGFAIWDERHRRLVLGRDRLGIKPLYYAVAGGRLMFGSELKALVRPNAISLTVDEGAVDKFFTFGYVPEPASIYREVRKLEPAHLLVWEKGQASLQQFWSLRFESDDRKDEHELAEEFVARFRDSVQSHLIGEVPLGAFLSGGIDSSFVVAMMSEATNTPVRTFTMAFGGSAGAAFDERCGARLVSERYQTAHSEFEIEPAVEEVLERSVGAFDEPFADDSIIPTFHICRLARREVTIALSGLGGDELFGGYERHLGFVLSHSYERLPASLRMMARAVVEGLPEPRSGNNRVNHIKRFVRSSGQTPATRYLQYVSVVPDSLKRDLYAGLSPPEESGFSLARFEADAGVSALGQVLGADLRTYLPGDTLTLTDRLSMLHSLEVRVPFLDHPLVEFCATIPDRFKIRRFTKKYLLRQAAKPFLPDRLIRAKKRGFGSPMGSWLRHELSGYARDVLSPSKLAGHGLFKPDVVRRLLDEHIARKESHERPLFALLMFQKWLDRR